MSGLLTIFEVVGSRLKKLARKLFSLSDEMLCFSVSVARIFTLNSQENPHSLGLVACVNQISTSEKPPLGSLLRPPKGPEFLTTISYFSKAFLEHYIAAFG